MREGVIECAPASARAVREPLAGTMAPAQAALLLRADTRPFALVGEWAGGGAILGSQPVRIADPEADPFAQLDDLPPTEVGEEIEGQFVGGGWFGWLGYPLAAAVEELPPTPPARASLRPWSLAFHDHVVRFDGHQWWFEALWTPARDQALRERRELWARRLAGPEPVARPAAVGSFAPIPPGSAGHRLVVADAVRRIAEGELFQVNVCLRLEASFEGELVDLFVRAIRAARPRFGAFFGEGVASLSPERFLRRVGRRVESDPIKGTAGDPGTLRASAKDAAEHVMIVDLMRNDLGRVCAYGSIAAGAPRIESHANVFHMVSTVSGRLRRDASDADLLRATFPPGSVTGAPKVQAMKTITQLEATARGLYTGAIGYASPAAGLELSVAIRTFESAGNRIWLGAGGGIVADSSPPGELAEALAKAAGPISAAGAAIALPPARRHVARAPALPRALAHGVRPDPRRGVFETVLAVDGTPQHAEAHLARLSSSLLELYSSPLPPDAAELLARAASSVSRGAARVRLEATPGPRGAVLLSARAQPVREPSPPPARLAPFLLPGGLGPHKWLDRRLPDAVAAAVPSGAHPVFVDADGLVLETHRANVWISEGGALVTPPADGRILPGVTRARVLAHGGREEPVALERMARTDRTLVSSAIALLAPVGPRAPDSPPADWARGVTAGDIDTARLDVADPDRPAGRPHRPAASRGA